MVADALPLLLPGVAGTGIVGLGAVAWHHIRARQRAVWLPPGTVALLSDQESWQRVRAHGRLALNLVGTYGVRQGARIIDGFRRAGCLDDIGAVAAVELDARQRTAFLGDLPAALRARTVFCPSTLLPGGLHGATVREAEAPALRQYWQPPLADTIAETCRLIRGTERTVFDPRAPLGQHGYDPAVILTVASPGGHTALGVFAASRLQAEFPLARSYVVTTMPADGQMRQQFPLGVRRYHEEGFVRHFVVTDNRRHLQHGDRAVATFFPSIWVAPLLAHSADEPWNILMRLFPSGFGGVIVPRYWERMLPSQATRAQPHLRFTFEDAIIRAVLDGLEGIEAEETKAITLPTPAVNTSRYVVVSLPLRPDALQRIQPRVEDALQASGWFAADGNRHLLWASLAENVEPDTSSVRMSIVMVEAAIDGLDHLAGAGGTIVPLTPMPHRWPAETAHLRAHIVDYSPARDGTVPPAS